ncbi:hypothetical protein AB0K00_35270, partial [Dactylosporangium sp. NPDC049525]|uniref:hypothetical protein n=1 Tax=Dactylosporangium sp. NPDC049525 TaxID=3154730 RepID=UPI0034233B51
MTKQPDNHGQDRRARLAAAAISGLLAGAARAGFDWLLPATTPAPSSRRGCGTRRSRCSCPLR